MANLQRGVMRHPKVACLSDAAFRLWIAGLDYCDELLTDGIILKSALRSHAVAARFNSRLVNELLRVVPPYEHPLWEDCADHYRVHDFLHWHSGKHLVQAGRKKTRERVAAYRLRQAGEGTPAQCDGSGNGAGNGSGNGVTEQPVTQGYCKGKGTGLLDNGLWTSEQVDKVSQREPPKAVPDEIPDDPPELKRCPPRIATGPHPNHAACGRPCVPSWTHQELRSHLGGDEDEADEKLRAWYPTQMEAWKDRVIGDRSEAFWWARFREWQGSTATVVKPTRTSGNEQAAAEALQLLRARHDA